jgi:AraC family transcriptional regulator, positive regulator of tynA and feaB
MRTLFSTADEDPKNSFRRWKDAVFERIVPVELTPTSETAFSGRLEAAEVGPLVITRVTQSAVRTEATPDTIRRHGKHETLNVAIVLQGRISSAQDDRTSIQGPGDLVVLDRRPTVMSAEADSRTLFIEVPRERLERALGSTRTYTALTVAADQPGTSLVTTFFTELARTHEGLTPDMGNRMAAIGVDLLIASLLERIARETPKSLRGTLIVQRALAHVEDNLGDPGLDPTRLAAAAGVSLRYLQSLFQERDRNIAEWIWQRRLEVAAQRLADPGYAHMPVGSLAYGCGFGNQAHFSRRFRDRFGLTPSEYRWRALHDGA